MPTYCTKEVTKINENAIEYMIVIQKSSSDDFDPIIKKLYIKRFYKNNILTSFYIRGYNFDFSEFKKTKLLLENCEIKINNNIQEAHLQFIDLPQDIEQWFGDIAFLFLFLIKTKILTENIIIKVNEDIAKNEVRRKDHISRRAFERFHSIGV